MRNMIAILAIALSLAACGEKKDAYSGIPQQQQYQQPMQQTPMQAPMQQAPAAPVIVNNEQSSVMPALLGAAAGYALGSMGNRGSNETRVVEREVYREAPTRSAVVPAPVPTPAIGSAVKSPVPSAPPAPAFTAPKPPVPVAPVVPAPSVKPNFTPGNYGTTTYNNAKPAMPVVPKPTQTPSYGGNSYKSAPSYGSSSYRSSSPSFSRSSGRR